MQPAQGGRLPEPDRVHNHVGAFRCLDDLGSREPARGIGPVAEEQHQRAPRVGLAQREPRERRVAQRRRARAGQAVEPGANRIACGRERHEQPDARGKRHERHPIAVAKDVEQRAPGVPERLQARPRDAAARVEHEHQIERQPLDLDLLDPLGDAAIEDLEGIRAEPLHRFIAHRDEHVDPHRFGA